VKAKQTLGASVSFVARPNPSSGGGSSISAVLVILGLATAIACFSVALVPATAVRWRAATTFISQRQLIFISQRQFDFTLAGFALLVATLFVYFLNGN
jgi:hypothetical protein